MNRSGRFTWIVDVTLTAMLVAFTAPALADENIHETREADEKSEVSIVNSRGLVTVTGWNREEVYVSGSLGEGVERLDISGDSKRMEIKVVEPADTVRVEETHLLVNMPEGGSVEVSTAAAEIKVDKVKGRIVATSVSGNIRARGKPDEVSATSVSGNIDISVVSDRIAADNVSGNVRLSHVSGAISATTVSGDVRIEDALFSNLSARTFSGDIDFEGDLGVGSTSHINSHSGGVTLTFPGDVDAAFDVSTFSGDIENDFGKDGEKASEFAPGSTLNFTAGAHEANVIIETFSGDVKLKKD